MLLTVFLAASASFFYVLATVVLKNWGSIPVIVSLGCILIFLALACAAEIAVLQRARFAEVVVLIISLEVAMALVLSRHYFAESYALRDVLGMCLLMIGAGLLIWEPTGAKALPPDGAIADSEVPRG